MSALAQTAGASGRTIAAQLRETHGQLRRLAPGVERVAVALYDPGTDKLTTFSHSTDGVNPLKRYEAPLGEVPSLARLARSHHARSIDDLRSLAGSPSEHSRRLLAKGYRSSYTLPFYDGDRFFGFLFFDSRQRGYFAAPVVARLSSFAQLLALAVVHAAAPARILDAALRVASRLTHYRDPETRSHLERMAHYAQLIARGLAAREGLSDEFLAFLLLSAPIHDIGKIAIPDPILLKPGRLSARELTVMRTHVTKGAEIVDGILLELGLKALPQVQMLRNVVLFHHEAMDGSGYPEGRRRDAIPLEARIVTVADVFDALTSKRPYKPAWPVPEALRYLERRAGTKFDARCVEVLKADRQQAVAIRARFKDAAGELQSREGYSAEL